MRSSTDTTLRSEPSFALGFLAAAPLALFYEWAVARGDGALRNSAERVLSMPLMWLGSAADPVRQLLLLLLTLATLLVARRLCQNTGEQLAPRVLRQPVEGLVGAMALGPALIWAQGLLDSQSAPFGYGRAAQSLTPSLEMGGLVAGGAIFEELVFRVGALSLAFLAWRAIVVFAGAPARAAQLVAESAAIVTSAALFAAFHLDALSHWVGVQGERWDQSTFAWRFLGGCLLAALYRWRGLGVAAWSHALFNLALLLGAGPAELR